MNIKNLFDSNGKHIANSTGPQLHSPAGSNIGHYVEASNIFIDMSGRYLGEIIHENRLMKQLNSPYSSTNYGSHGNFGSIGNYGNPGNCGNIGSIAGFEDVHTDKL